MSASKDPPEFNTIELLSLYATMVMKRIVNRLLRHQSSIVDDIERLVKAVQDNLSKMNFDKNWFFATLRDHARVHHDEWQYIVNNLDLGRMAYNTVLLIVALRLGLEKLWHSDGNLPLLDDAIHEYFMFTCDKSGPKFGLTHLDQYKSIPHFEFFAHHSPNLYSMQLPLSDNESFKQCCITYRNLREVGIDAGVSDKVMCNAFWNSGTKKSDKVLELALKDGGRSLALNLPHLRVLRSNILMMKPQSNAIRLSLGAAALIIQPEMETVKNEGSWDTYNAVVHILEIQRKLGLHPSSNSVELLSSKDVTAGNAILPKKQEILTQISSRPNGLEVKHLCVPVSSLEENKWTARVMKVCPKLTGVELIATENIALVMPLLINAIPMHQLTSVIVDTPEMEVDDLRTLLNTAVNCKHVTLRVTEESLTNLDLSFMPPEYLTEEEKNLRLFLQVETLVLEFTSEDDEDDDDDEYLGINDLDMAQPITAFFFYFPNVKELYLRSALLVTPLFLVHECIAGALQIYKSLHLSIIGYTPDIPTLEDTPVFGPDPPIGNCNEVMQMLCSFEYVSAKSLKSLKSLEIDCVLVNDNVDFLLKALRADGVLVSVLNRPTCKRYLRLSDLLKAVKKGS